MYNKIDEKKFRKGDFVRLAERSDMPSFGIVHQTHTKEELIDIMRFEAGFPLVEEHTKDWINLATKAETLAYLQGIHGRLRSQENEELLAKRALPAILAICKYDFLDHIISQIEESGDRAKITVPEPSRTGIYLIMGFYAGHGPSDHLEVIKQDAGEDIRKLSKRLIRKYPYGFGKIPKEVVNTPATSHGVLVSYGVVEVPKSAADRRPSSLTEKYMELLSNRPTKKKST